MFFFIFGCALRSFIPPHPTGPYSSRQDDHLEKVVDSLRTLS